MSAPPITERHLPHFHRRAPMKEAVRAATTANITISTALNNGDSLDGLTLATGDRVLVKNQSTGSQNGIYVVGASPARDYDESTDDPSFGYLVYVREGTTNGGTLWKNTNTAAPTIGSTSLTFSQFSSSGAVYGTPNLTLGTSNAAGSTDESIRRDATILVFDATAPTTQAFGDSAATGSAGTAARRDHKHAMPTAAITTSGLTQATGKLLGRTTASTGAVEEISVGTGLILSAGSLSATGGGGAIDLTGDTGSASAIDDVTFAGAGGIDVTVTDDGGGAATVTIDGSGVSGGGGGAFAYPLDRSSVDATYGDHFTGPSLSGWTRRNFTSGAESYQLGPLGTFLRIALSGRATGDGYFRSAPAGDWTFAMSFIPRFYDGGNALFGLAVVDTNGTGAWIADGNGTPAAIDLLQLTTYTSYGGSYVEAGYNGTAPNVSYFGVRATTLHKRIWLKLRKSGTNYYGAFSLDGELWGPESSALAWAGTVDRIGFIYGPLSGATVTNAYVDIDWFDKIA